MTGVDAALVWRKLARIRRNLDELAPFAALRRAEYQQDLLRRKAIERLLQEVGEAAADIILHLLRVLDRPTPSDYYESFVQVGKAGTISGDLAEALAPSAGLRNRLVHDYDEIDHEIVLSAIGESLALFRRYVRSVEEYLTSRGF